MSRWMMDRCSGGDAVHLWEPSCCEASSTTCVPVAVIDFGQTAEVDRLRRLCPGDWCFDQDDEARVEVNAYLAVALREFADPKPPACGSSIDLHYSDGKGCNYTCTLAAGHNGMHACADSVMWGGAA